MKFELSHYIRNLSSTFFTKKRLDFSTHKKKGKERKKDKLRFQKKKEKKEILIHTVHKYLSSFTFMGILTKSTIS